MVKSTLKKAIFLLFITFLGGSLFSYQNTYALNHYEIKNGIPKYYPFFVKELPLSYDLYGNKVSSNITELDFTSSFIDENLVSHLAHFKYLSSVDLRGHDLSIEEMVNLKKNYSQIDFHFEVPIGNQIYDSHIEDLDLSYIKITDLEDFKNRLSLLTRLKTLDMSECNLTNEQLGNLREEFPTVTIDWVIHLSKWKFRTDVTSFSVLVYRFDYVKITSKDLEVFKYCRNLEGLDLGHQAITDISAIGKYLPDLKILILSDNRISDISPLASLTKLHYLELFINPIHDISAVSNMKELVDINLCYDKIYDYSPLYELPYLERIWLVGTGVNQQVISKLRATFPKAQIVHTGGGSTNSGFRTHERYYEMLKMFKDRYYMSPSFAKYNGISNHSEQPNYLNQKVDVVIDYKIGSKNNNLIYLTNYGHLKDNHNVNAYVLGEFSELKNYTGNVIAIIRKDNEDVLVVSNKSYSDDAIKALVEYKEKNHKYTIIH